MSGGERVGKKSGVTGDDFARAPDPGGLAPGKRNLVQSQFLGNKWGDHGAKCDGNDGPGCFLADDVRLRYLIDFKDDVRTAATNYKLALQALRFEEMLKKEDDLNWVLALALEIAGAHLLDVAVKALGGLKASGAQKFMSAAFKSENFEGWSANAAKVLNKITAKQLETYTKVPITAAKKKVSDGVKNGSNAGDKAEKTAVLSYIDQLTEECDGAFRNFQSNASANASDAELAVLFDGMNPENHSVGIYKDVLGQKIDRFKQSGVLDLGRKDARDRMTGQVGVHRDTRVIWLRDILNNRRLYYQSQDGNADYSVIRPGDPADPRSFPEQSFGPHDPREAPVLGDPVPEEFQAVALARSEQLWGFTNEIEDPFIGYMRKQGLDPYKGVPGRNTTPPAKQPAAAPPGPTTAPPGTAPPAPPPGTPIPSLQLKDIPPKASKTGVDPDDDLNAAGFKAHS